MAIKRTGLRPEDKVRPRGVHFPFMKRSDGLPSADVPPQVFASSVKQILATTPGERVMRPTFGSSLRNSLFENVPSEALVMAVQNEVVRAVNLWEPRVGIANINVQIRDTTIIVVVTLLSPFGPAQTELSFKVN